MKRKVSSLAAVAVATVAAGALLTGLASTPAHAAGPPSFEPDANSVGGLVFYNSAGQVITGGSINDQPLAAYVEGTVTPLAGSTKATLYGFTPQNGSLPTAWTGFALGASPTYPNASAPAPLNSATLPVYTGGATDVSIGQYAGAVASTDTADPNVYQLRLYTSGGPSGASSKYDSADILISGTTWSVAYTAAPTATSTTTTLTTTPGSPQQAGTSVELDASVSPVAAGTIQFKDGATNIGSPVTVDGSGAASTTTSSLSVGPHSLSAVFTPTSPFFGTSTGTAAFTVSAAPAANTTTALSVNPTTAAADTLVTFTAAVTRTTGGTALGADGNVKFVATNTADSSTINLGTAPLNGSGIATQAYSNFAAGSYTVVATFVPTSSASFNGSSSSPPLAFTATAPQFAPDDQGLDVNIPAGTLTITSPYTAANPFHLGTAVLNPAGSEFTASAAFGDASNPNQGVSITDTRAGDLPWTASATVTDFQDAGSDVINGQNLSFTGVTPAYIAGNALQAGSVTVHDVTSTPAGGTPYGATATGTDGLKGGPHQFAAATAGDGSVYVDGSLNLAAPSSTPSGTYTATLTFTIA